MSGRAEPKQRWRDPLLVTVASLFGFLILGHHPYSEDGGIYAAAVAGRMDPSLFPAGHAWVAAHTHFAWFVPLVAWMFRHLRISLAVGLVAVQIFGLVCTLAVALRLGRLCFAETSAARWGVVVLGMAAGLPVAGTSLYLVDPYVTARTLTTPLLLFALRMLLEDRIAWAVLLWGGAMLLHPLMACWGALPMLFVVCGRRAHPARWIAVLLAGVMMAAACVSMFAPPDAAVVHTLALTRGYWFLARWRWFEWVGAVAPLGLLLAMWHSRRLARLWTRSGVELIRAMVLAGSLALLAATLFASAPGQSTLLARVQPLRTFHELYFVFLLLLGGISLQWLGSRMGLGSAFATAVAIGVAMLVAQRSIYPASRHLEMPWSRPANAWQEAFLWVRENTPKEALFAMDADYIDAAGEDAQGFRAIALRSVLPDRAKDGGIASVMPSLAAEWQRGVQAQTGLDAMRDTERSGRLLPLGVDWLILPAQAETALPCPYRNGSVAVCRLR